MTSFALESAGGYTQDPAAYSPDTTGPKPTWTWRLEDPTGTVMESATATLAAQQLPGGVLAFGSRSDAESWLGETWRTLAAEGVHAATLFSGDQAVGGPIPLK